MKSDNAFGLVFIGDPHIGDQGCNIGLLRKHINTINKTPNLYGIGLGDYTNNWAGRLAQRLAPLEETTRPQVWKLVDWFFRSVDWFLLIKGNHDVWSGADDESLVE
jgi:UDP-2,3-diacylglucosamine pyrophosphatase LpxH